MEDGIIFQRPHRELGCGAWVFVFLGYVCHAGCISIERLVGCLLELSY